MSHSKILLRALPNVEFVHGYPGIPAGPERPQATIRGTIEVRLGKEPVKVKWIKVELRKVETIPSGSSGEDFIDFVGQSPMTIWQAQDEDELLSTKDLPFNIRLPETIPPSVALGRGAGIKYEVVATLCMKGKKGLWRREASTNVSHAVPVVIDKHELHSTWPVYAQPESRQVTSDGLTLVVNRSNTCFAPADRLGVMATLKSDNLSPVVLRGFEFSLRETIIYRAGPQSHSKKNGPQVHTSILGEQKVPVSMTLYGGTQHKAELGCIIPGNHTTSSVNAGRHIDIGYTLNIKALLDKAKPISMDLPVTITNWPRHVSADMIRRIGTAPNLTLTPPGGPGIPSVVQASDLRAILSPALPPPVGGLPKIPTSGGHQTVPPGALISGPPGSPVFGTALNGGGLYSPGVHGTSGQIPLSSGAQQILQAASSQNSLGSGSLGGHPGSAGTEKTTFAASNDVSEQTHAGVASEFGYRRPGNIPSASTRQNQNHDSGVIDVARRSASMGSPRVSGRDTETSGATRTSYHAPGVDIRPNISGPTSSLRRPRAMSRTLQIVNATEEIPEDDSPVKDTALKPFDEISQSPQDIQSVSPPVTQTSPNTPWPTAEEEKQRLFDKAKAKAAKVQAQAKVNAGRGSPVQNNSPPHSNGRSSPSSVELTIAERPRTVSPSFPKPSWLTAEDEKRRLFEQAQANVRRTQGMVQAATQSPAANGSAARLSHHRTTSANSSQDSGKRPNVTASPPTISAGAALYSHAIASMKSPVMPNFPQTSSSATRIPASQVASSSNTSASAKPHSTAEDEKSTVRYREAHKAVELRQKEDEVPQEDPIAYDALFPLRSPSTVSPLSSQGVRSPQLSEKEVLRRAFEARDAAVAASQHTTPAPTIFAAPNGSQPPTRTSPPPPPPPPPPEPLSEKEVLRRAFEARDAAMMRSGQVPPAAAAAPMRSVSPQTSVWRGGSISSRTGLKERTPLSEKEQMRIAFENRDRTLAAQQFPLPPEYGTSPTSSPIVVPSFSPSDVTGGGHLTAAEEKAQLKARYAEESDSGPQADEPVGASVTYPRAAFEHASSPTEDSHKSESSEGYLRRDPTISAGKKRASQMTTPPPPPPPPLPPPLLPRPPPEYIEETKLEDMKNNLSPTVTLPIDFSAPLDLGFTPFDNEHSASSSSSALPEPRSG